MHRIIDQTRAAHSTAAPFSPLVEVGAPEWSGRREAPGPRDQEARGPVQRLRDIGSDEPNHIPVVVQNGAAATPPDLQMTFGILPTIGPGLQ